MKKKTKFKSRTRIFTAPETLSFFAAELVCILFVITGLIIFKNNYTMSLSKTEEAPVAYVSAKVKTSRRCFDKRNMWDILQKNSFIYNGDTICTEDNSQAVLVFIEDGVEITLTANTMTQIRVGEDKALNLTLKSGNILVDSSAKAGPATIVYNDSSISMNGKALVSAAELNLPDNTLTPTKKEKPVLEVQVLDGKASVKSGRNNKSVEVSNGQMVRVSEVKEKVESKNKKDKTETLPEEFEEENTVTAPVEIAKSKVALPVTVLVKKENKLKSNTKAAEDTTSIKKIADVVKTEIELTAPKKEISFEEKLQKNDSGTSMLQKLIESSEEKVKVETVVQKTQAKPKDKKTSKPAAKQASKPTVKPEPKVEAKPAQKTSTKPVAKPVEEKTPSEKTEATIAVLENPQLFKPYAGIVFDDNYFMEHEKIVFVWSEVKGATNYKFILKDSSGKIILEKNTGAQSNFTLSDLTILTNGKNTYWTVQALTQKNGRVTAASDIKKSYFTVKLGEISGDASVSGNMYGR